MSAADILAFIQSPYGLVVAAGVAALFLGIITGAKLTGHWQTNLPRQSDFDLVPRADTFMHPR
jgi:hypothetical protein